MAPPTILGRSQGLFPENDLARQRTQRRHDAWTRMFGGRLGPMPYGGAGMGVETSLPPSARPRDQQLYGDAANMPSARNLVDYPGRSPSVGPLNLPGQMAFPWQGPRPMSPQLLNGQGPLRQFGREGLSPLFNVPPQSPYRPGSAPGMSPLGGGEMAAQDSIQATIDQIRFDRENLRDMRMRQGELKQGQFDQTWSNYATQAPLMNQRVSPEFGYAAQGLGPGGVAPMTPGEQAYMGRRNAYPDQPGTSQMYDRFGGGPLTGEALRGFAPSALNNDYDGQVRMQVGGYGSPLSGPLGESRDPEFSDKAVAARQAERNMRILADQDLPGGGSSRLRQARKDIDDRREAMGLRRSDDMRGRIADRDAARAERLRSGEAQNLSRRGISPLSAEGQSLAPGLYGSLRAQRSGAPAGQGSPLTAPDGTKVAPVSPSAPRSASTMGQAGKAYQAVAVGSPLFRTAGVAYDETGEGPAPQDAAVQVGSWLAQNNWAAAPEDLMAMHLFAQQAIGSATQDPFEVGLLTPGQSTPHLKAWKELGSMRDPSRSDLAAWMGKYRSEVDRFGANAVYYP